MMSTDKNARPELEEVIDTLLREKRLTPTTPVLSDLVGMHPRSGGKDDPPKFECAYAVNPDFHSNQLHNSIYFILIRLPFQNEGKLNLLFTLLEFYFDSSYSSAEVYGTYDFVIKIWSKKDGKLIKQFATSINSFVLEYNKTNLLCIFRAEHAHYAWPRFGKLLDVDKAYAMAKLHDLQEAKDSGANEIEWLRGRAIITDAPKFDPYKHIQVFMLINCLSIKNAANHTHHFKLLQQALTKSKIPRSARLAHFARGYENTTEFDQPSQQFIISYVAANYRAVSEMTDKIVSALSDDEYRIQCNSLLSTGRHFIHSEKIKFPDFVSDSMESKPQ